MLNSAQSFGGRFLSVGGVPLAIPYPRHHYSKAALERFMPVVEYVMAHSPVVIQGDAVSNDPSFFGGALPTAATNIVVPEGSTLTISAGDTFIFNCLIVYGRLVIKGAISGKTTINFDTIAIMPSGEWELYEPTGREVIFEVRTETDIPTEQDPYRVSRGLLFFGRAVTEGKARQYLIPTLTDITAGETVDVTLSLTPFLGENGPAGDPNDRYNYTRWDLDWQAGEQLVAVATAPRADWMYPLQNEVVEIDEFTLQQAETAFSKKDPMYSTLRLKNATVFSHLEYYDKDKLEDIRVPFGPEEGRQTRGSHANFFGRPFLANPNRSIKFLMTTPNAPAHRRGYIGIYSSAVKLHWTEVQRFGRTSLYDWTVKPSDLQTGTLTPQTNHRYQHAIMVYDAGFYYFSEVSKGSGCVSLIGNSVWGGLTGAAVDDIGAQVGSGIAQIHSSVYAEANFVDNCIGAGMNVLGAADTHYYRHNVVSGTWGERTNVASPRFFKDHDMYSTDDTGREGSNYMAVTRMGVWFRNFSFGAALGGRNILTRSAATADETMLPAEFIPDGPEQIQYQQFLQGFTDDRPRLMVQGDYATACNIGSMISKNGPDQGHGYRSQIKDCVYIGNRRGEAYEYTAQYHLDRHIILGLGDNTTSSPDGLDLGTAVTGFTCNDFYIANVGEGVYNKRGDAAGNIFDPEEADVRFVNFRTMKNVAVEFNNVDVEHEIVTKATPYDDADFGFHVIKHENNKLIGVFRDSLGDGVLQFPHPENENKGIPCNIPLYGSKYASVHGYFINTDGDSEAATYMRVVVQDRLVPERLLKVDFPVKAPLGHVINDYRWRHASGALYELEYHGEKSHAAEWATANETANNNVDFTDAIAAFLAAEAA